MKKTLFVSLAAVALMGLLSGCVGLSVGGGTKSESRKPTLGQQLVDLQHARDSGAITEAQYEQQKARLLAQ